VGRAAILATLREVLGEASVVFQGATGEMSDRVLLVAGAAVVRAAAVAARAAPITSLLAVWAEQLPVRMVQVQPR
jgi:hypothetical protein